MAGADPVRVRHSPQQRRESFLSPADGSLKPGQLRDGDRRGCLVGSALGGAVSFTAFFTT
jgi:hypothetical protein